MKAVDLELEHLRSIKVREMERDDLGENIFVDLSPGFMRSHYKKAVLNESGEVVMCMGGRVSDSTAWVWIIASDLIYKNPIASLEMIVKLEEEAIEMHRVKMLYTFNSPKYPLAIRFLERIGYSEKGTTSDFADGKERVIMVKEVS